MTSQIARVCTPLDRCELCLAHPVVPPKPWLKVVDTEDSLVIDLTGGEATIRLIDGEVDGAIWSPRYRGIGLVAKRAIDVFGALILLFLLAPFMVVIAGVLLVKDEGPIMFSQSRVGRAGAVFRVHKFRTMKVNAEQLLAADPVLLSAYVENDFKLEPHEDPRVTPVGAFLRRTSLDELPQLLNVLRGEMSLVGPRPVLPDELEQYGPAAPAYLAVYPGVTGVWQTSGRNEIRYPERAGLDVDYAKNWSLGLDVKILLKTIPSVLSQRGVS